MEVTVKGMIVDNVALEGANSKLLGSLLRGANIDLL